MVDWIGLRGSHNFLQIAFAAKCLEFSELLAVSSSQVLYLVLSTPSWNVLVEHDIFSKGWNYRTVTSKAFCTWTYGAMSHLPEHNCKLPYMHPVIQVSFCHNRNKTFLSGFRWNKKGFNPSTKMSEGNRKRSIVRNIMRRSWLRVETLIPTVLQTYPCPSVHIYFSNQCQDWDFTIHIGQTYQTYKKINDPQT